MFIWFERSVSFYIKGTSYEKALVLWQLQMQDYRCEAAPYIMVSLKAFATVVGQCYSIKNIKLLLFTWIDREAPHVFEALEPQYFNFIWIFINKYILTFSQINLSFRGVLGKILLLYSCRESCVLFLLWKLKEQSRVFIQNSTLLVQREVDVETNKQKTQRSCFSRWIQCHYAQKYDIMWYCHSVSFISY